MNFLSARDHASCLHFLQEISLGLEGVYKPFKRKSKLCSVLLVQAHLFSFLCGVFLFFVFFQACFLQGWGISLISYFLNIRLFNSNAFLPSSREQTWCILMA